MPKDSKATQSRLFVDIPMSTLRKLLLWSASRGDTKNGWARTIIVLRCDENYPKVQAWLEEEAANLNISRNDLEHSILERMGFDFTAYRNEMLNR
jgi:hypothetical protein